MASETKRKRYVLSENRALIAKVFHYLKDEYQFTVMYKEPNCDVSHLRNITRRTAEATGTSTRTVSKILQEERALPSATSKFPEPLNRQKRPSKIDIDIRIAYAVRSLIRDFYVAQKQIPTIQKVKLALNEKIGYDACPGTVRQLLLKLGFTWTKCDTGKKALIERHDVQMSRLQYLKKVTEYRSQGQPIVYMDESFVTTKNARLDARNPTVRYILAHAGTEAGFIEDGCLVYQTNSFRAEENVKMIFDCYQKWLDEKLLPNLPANSVLVLDSSSFNNIPVEPLPTMHSDKTQMQAWLTSKGIQFNTDLRQVELYDLIKQHKSAYTTYKIDSYIKSKGFEVLRLPPQHPELNAIQIIWDSIKSYIVTVDDNYSDTEKVIEYCVEKITEENWRNSCNDVIKKETEYLEYFDTGFSRLANLQDEREDKQEEDTTSDEYLSDDYEITYK